jgi:hypothetical protein
MKSKCIQFSVVLAALFFQMLPLTSQVKDFSIVISPKADQYGLVQVAIRNNSKRNVTAAFVAYSCSNVDGIGTHESAVGFESILYVSIGSDYQDPGLPPLGVRHFQIKPADVSCSETTSAIFSDGQCEGSTEGTYGCTQMLANRRAAYEELVRLRSFILAFSDQDPEYISKLTAYLESRRVELSQFSRSDASKQGVAGRTQVLQCFKYKLPPYTIPPPELSMPTHTLNVVSSWMTLLAANISPTQG